MGCFPSTFVEQERKFDFLVICIHQTFQNQLLLWLGNCLNCNFMCRLQNVYEKVLFCNDSLKLFIQMENILPFFGQKDFRDKKWIKKVWTNFFGMKPLSKNLSMYF